MLLQRCVSSRCTPHLRTLTNHPRQPTLQEVNRCRRGDFFGERALLTKEPRAATLTASGDVQLLKLDRNAFSLLLGPLEDIMNDGLKRYEETGTAEKKKVLPSVNIPFEDLSVIGTLGKGSFGHVQLVQDKAGKTYALKAVSKAQIVQTGQQGHIMSEKRVMEQMDHPFLVKL